MIELRDLSVERGQNAVLRALTMTLPANSLTVILGQNGAGKSTLLRCVAGDIAHTGEIIVNHLHADVANPSERARWLSVLPQQSSLAFDFSVNDILLMGRMPHPEPAAVSQTLVDQVADTLGLKAMLQRSVLSLSGGEQRRVQFARVMLQVWQGDNGLTLLDEPTDQMDIPNQRQCLAVLRDWVQQGNTAVLTLHDINLAIEFADHLVFLKQGRLLAAGAPSVLALKPVVEACYDVTIASITPHPRHGKPVVIF